MEIVTRAKAKRKSLGIYKLNEAEKLGLDFYDNGKPCKNGIFGMRKTKLKGKCVCSSCYEEHKERVRQYQKKKRQAAGAACGRPPKTDQQKKDRYKKWVKENRERVNQQQRKWRQANREKLRPYQSAYNAIRWKITSRPLAKLHLEKIVLIYEERDRTTKETGIDHHVDHIVPLLGKNVCGLHVPWNMQIIPAYENRVKSNKWETV